MGVESNALERKSMMEGVEGEGIGLEGEKVWKPKHAAGLYEEVLSYNRAWRNATRRGTRAAVDADAGVLQCCSALGSSLGLII